MVRKGSLTLAREHNSAKVNAKMVNHKKSPYRKDQNFDIVDQLCTRLQDIKDQESSTSVGMHLFPPDQKEAVQKYYAAFPALKKGEESPQQYYLPAPTWCCKTADNRRVTMQSELKELSQRNKKPGRERRNSYHCQRRASKRRGHNQSRSFESKASLPEWVTDAAAWDIEAQDPIGALLDEGYGTGDHTAPDADADAHVPDWETLGGTGAGHAPPAPPSDDELYARFEAKFDRSLEALWASEASPDDDCQELPIDLHELLASPSDNQLWESAVDKCSLVSLTDSVWSNDGSLPAGAPDTPTRSVDRLHDCFKPLNLADEAFLAEEALLADEAFLAAASLAPFPPEPDLLRSFAAINHSARSRFTEPRRLPPAPRRDPPAARHSPATAAAAPGDDPLTSARTHFRPIRCEARGGGEQPRHQDGATFPVSADLEPASFCRSSTSGLLRLDGDPERARRYLELREPGGPAEGQVLRFALRRTDQASQTEPVASLAWRACGDCGRAKKKRAVEDPRDIWAGGERCAACASPAASPAAPDPPDPREWEELLADISAAHAQYASEAAAAAGAPGDRKRRHSAARGLPPPPAGLRCSHPHAPFLHCAGPAHRPLTR